MKSSGDYKGFGVLLFVLFYLRTSTCSFVSFTITPTTGPVLGSFNALGVTGGVETTITQNRPGPPSFSPIEIAVDLGKADLTLMDSLLKGARLPQVDISFYGNNQAQQYLYRKITLTNAFVTSYTSAAESSTNTPTTTFALKFLKRVDATYPAKPGAAAVAQNTYDLLARTVTT